jgi:apolipoprotein N-acyltransferase
MIGTSIYVHNYIVCFKCFLLVVVCFISYEGFQTKDYKLVAVIMYVKLKKEMKSWFFAKTQWIVYLWGVSVFIYAKTVDS